MTEVASRNTTNEGSSKLGPALDEHTRNFVRRCLSAGLVQIDDIKKVVVSLMAESKEFTPERLAEGLVGGGWLTSWQSRKLLSGASKGFYLGSYRLLRPLGRGGMGVVYLGEHHVMKRQMALKILPPEDSRDEKRIERFKAEAQACAQLDHENIVRAYDFGEAGGKLFIVMEYIDGIDLGQAVHRDGVMSPAAALDVLTQATAGLAHAHERGIVHRDIKPSNMLLRSDGVVKVSDLGLARIGVATPDSENGKRLVGTADYLAPEQAIDSKTVDSRADIYSLGCSLVYLLTGRPPFSGQTVQQTLAKHQTAAIPNLRELVPECSPALSDLCRRMMSKRPEERPKSAVELLAQLKRLGGRTTVSSEVPVLGVSSSDTMVDEAGFSMTVPGSGPPAGIVDGEINFSNLPTLDLGDFSSGSLPGGVLSPAALPAVVKAKPAATPEEKKQNLLLLVGLGVAMLALFGVGFSVYKQVTAPPANSQPTKVKSYDDPEQGKIIIVDRE
ncbi:MAG: serine/threonine-protein kinase [Planctomycetota bacterium]